MRDAPSIAPRRPASGSVAYVLKAYPRLSETYILSEIHRLERLGLALRIYALKTVEPEERGARHGILDRIRAQPVYLPAVATVSGTSLRRWLLANGGPFVQPLARVLGRWPAGTLRAAWAAFAQALRARDHRYAPLRKIYLKEFLQAVALSDQLRAAPDVRLLHAHYAHSTATVAWLASQITGLPFSFTAHAKDVYSESLNPAGLLRRKLLAARFALTCTGAGAKHLRALAPGARVHLVYHGLNAELQRFAGEQAGSRTAAGDGTLRMLSVGRLVEKKGFDTLVDACVALRHEGVPFETTIAGPDGPYGDAVRRRIEMHGLGDQIRLAGPMSQEELFGEYVRADAFCLPCRIVGSDRDGIPNVLIEAMACGTPAISTGISGIPELISDGADGLLVAPGDPAGLAAVLRRLHEDRALGARLGAAGRSTVLERFDGDRLAEQLAQLFRTELGR